MDGAWKTLKTKNRGERPEGALVSDKALRILHHQPQVGKNPAPVPAEEEAGGGDAGAAMVRRAGREANPVAAN